MRSWTKRVRGKKMNLIKGVVRDLAKEYEDYKKRMISWGAGSCIVSEEDFREAMQKGEENEK